MERISVLFFGLSLVPLIFIDGTAGHMLFLACLIAPFILVDLSSSSDMANRPAGRRTGGKICI